MTLHLARSPARDGATLGELTIDGAHECWTLERDITEGKGPIPAGRYQIVVTWSPAFGRLMPLLVRVPGFDGIRIHPGNTVEDTLGCICVGETEGDAFIGASVAAFDALYPKIEAACATDEGCWIEIVDAVAQVSPVAQTPDCQGRVGQSPPPTQPPAPSGACAAPLTEGDGHG